MKDVKKSCAFGEAAVSYLYDELAPADREIFEDHLVDCISCTDEFAAIAESRYEVYEWTKEFAEIPTPRFVIPYREFVPWNEAVRRVFQAAFGLPTASVAFASLLVFASLAYFWITAERPDVTNVGPVIEGTVAISISAPGEPKALSTSMEASETGKSTSLTKANPIAVKMTRQAAKRVSAISHQTRLATTARRDVNSPRLTEFADDSDDSLRLAELFDEIGSSE